MKTFAVKAGNARRSAFNTLRTIETASSHADAMIDRELSAGVLEGPDRALFAEIVFGVLRHRGLVDHVLGQYSSKPPESLDAPVLEVLRTAFYQLMKLDRIPESAAVNEAVNLAHEFCPKASGFINAVLRSFLRAERKYTLPDRDGDPEGHIAAAHSLPQWIVRALVAELGMDEACRTAAVMTDRPPLILRCNALKTGRDEFMRLLADNGTASRQCRLAPLGVIIGARVQIERIPGYAEGFFSVQDEASQIVPLLLDPKPGERILDACAAPGGKTSYIAELAGDAAEIVAVDISAKKLGMVRDSCARLGIRGVETIPCDMSQPGALKGELFDRILVDAPCSGLGVIRRNPEAKWRLKPEDVIRLAATQKSILHNTAQLLKPGGVLVYSTCSFARQEDEDVVADFLLNHPDFVLDGIGGIMAQLQELVTDGGALRTWPHRNDMDAFFAVSMRKKDKLEQT